MDFIDYEYSERNAAAFDIANHFNEYCGNDVGMRDTPSGPLYQDEGVVLNMCF